MAVTVPTGQGTQTNNQGTAGQGNNSLTALTQPAGSTLLICGIAFNGTLPTLPTMTYGTMTAAVPILSGTISNTGVMSIALFLIAPTVSSGTLQAGWSGANRASFMFGIFFAGTDTVTGINNSNTVNTGLVTAANPSSGAITGTANGATLALTFASHAMSSPTGPSGFVNLYTTTAPGPNGVSYALGISGPNTFGFTAASGVYGVVGINIIAASGGGVTVGWAHRTSMNFPGGR